MSLPLPAVMQHYNTILALPRGSYAVAFGDIKNDHQRSLSPVISSGTVMKVDFVADDRFYAFAAMNGTMVKVAIRLEDFNSIIPVKE